MPHYTTYGTQVTYFNAASLGAARFLADGVKWGGAPGTGVTLTYSFPSGYAYHANGYTEFNSWFGLNSAERTAVKIALGTWSHVANVGFGSTNVGDNTNVGELRFAFSHTLGSGTAAHAYYPAQSAWAGDVWFNPVHFNDDGGGVPVGSYDFLTIVHEIGHSLGLKHSFEGTYRLPASQDNYFWTVMSYTASPSVHQGDNYASFYPTTPMYLDLVAIQAMYGVRPFATGNNNYVFYDGIRYWQTIHDTGGNDTIVYSGVESSSINLNAATFSALSERISFNTGSTRSTVSIGPGTVIENARGGSGNDVLTGNAANNNLQGLNGNDTLLGGPGNDYIVGGNGNDVLRGGIGNDYQLGGAGLDIFHYGDPLNAATNRDAIGDYNPAQDRFNLDNAVFTLLGAAGPLNSALFRAAAKALDGNDRIVYNRATGELAYDVNGNGPGGSIVFVVLPTKPVLTAGEFFVV